MLFNSFEFLAIYLPLVIGVYYVALRNLRAEVRLYWLLLASFFFWGYWNPVYLPVMLLSIGFNFFVGKGIDDSPTWRKRYLIFGISSNLLLLFVFKYYGFVVENLNHLTGASIHAVKLELPIGISFFTFTQIAFLVDHYKGEEKSYSLAAYSLFVMFFPHLIAGPIIHHKQVLPQIHSATRMRFDPQNLQVGLSFFAIGLFKKVIVADGAALYSSPVFSAAARGVQVTFFEAWGGALAYTFQIYFDFSGYSDMCLGLARCFGIYFPVNFNSPYQARNIIEFWQRWHMTLSHFLRDYLYIPLGGNRYGALLRYRNLFATMLLGGLWHGANWTYVAWGALHGGFLVLNHFWRAYFGGEFENRFLRLIYDSASRLLTFFCIVIAWVFFRAENMDVAVLVLKGMAGQHGTVVTLGKGASIWGPLLAQVTFLAPVVALSDWHLDTFYFYGRNQLAALGAMLLFTWIAPNSQDIFRHAVVSYEQKFGVGLDNRASWWTFRPGVLWALIIAGCSCLSLLYLQRKSEFIYFQF